MKKALAILQIVCILFWNVPLAKADDSDIFGSNIQPNVLILIDQSGSMDQIIQSASYDPATTYPGSRTSTKVYKENCWWSWCWHTVYANSVSEVNSSSAQAGLNSVGYWSGSIGGSSVQLFMGNYLNYQNCTSCPGAQTKIAIAKQVVTDLFNNVQGVRFGVMDFQNASSPYGATMVAPIGTDTATMISAVNGLTASGGTPTGEALQDVGNYFSGTFSGYSTPIEYSCQPNFVILISDGMWNGSIDPATQATAEFTTDHSSTLAGMQNLITYTVGFNLPAGDPGIASLQQTATNGGGTYYSANNSAQLQAALQATIQQIIAATFGFASPVIPTTTTSGTARAYLASFQSNASRPFWRGYLKAYNRDANGLIPVDGQGVPLDTAIAWDAGQKLSVKTASTRTISTYASGALQSFTKTNAAITNALLNAADGTERDKIIDFIRGIDSYDENANNNFTEERAWKLGDIFHSTPVLVSPPFLPSADSTYNSFKATNASRTTVLLAGANDGMLHAFKESDGEESWAFIPPAVLGDLKDLAVNSGIHSYYVDSSPIAADVKIGSNWKTMVIFGQRRGGTNYYALDITNTTDPQYLWSFTDAKMADTWSEPVIGKVKMSDNSDKYVAFIGGGYNTAQNNNSGKAFFVIDIANGAKLWEYYNPGSATDDKQYMNFSLTASPTAVDLNNDGYIDRVYIGDVGGQLWKFDVSAGATLSGGLVTNWTGKRVFAAASSQANPPATGEYYPAQAIYAPPALSYDTALNLWVYFGTGDRNHPNNTSTNRFYGIKENTSMTNGSVLTESSLTDVTSGTGTVTQGWYIALASNEKVLSAADVFNKAVFFTTFTPTSTVACSTGGGNAKLYAVNLTSGDAAINLTTGAVLTAGQSALSFAKAIGTGIPSRPVIIVNQSGNSGTPYVITGTTNRQLSNSPAPPVTVKRLLAWREVF